MIMKLELAFKDKNSEAVEVALYDKPVNDPHYIKLLINLLGEDWHTSHENIARYIQLLKPESAVPVLLSVATKKLSYLEYDNSLGLSRKCTWALADIGTNQSKSALQKLADCGDSDIEDYAKKRLSKWNDELARKSV
jgi:hypothetical protein